MADPIITFTRPEVDMLSDMVKWWKKNGRSLRSRSDRPQPNEEDDVGGYLAYTPIGGIPALAPNTTGTGTGTIVEDDVPGFVDCEVYKLIQPDTATNTRVVVPAGFTVTVYNMTTAVIDGNKWVMILQDNWGTWYVPPQVSVTVTSSGYYANDRGSGLLTADVEIEPQTFGTGLVINQAGTYLITYMMIWSVEKVEGGSDSIAFSFTLANLDGPSGPVAYVGDATDINLVDEPLSVTAERWDLGLRRVMGQFLVAVPATEEETFPITLTTQMVLQPSAYDTNLGDTNHAQIIYWNIIANKVSNSLVIT